VLRSLGCSSHTRGRNGSTSQRPRWIGLQRIRIRNGAAPATSGRTQGRTRKKSLLRGSVAARLSAQGKREARQGIRCGRFPPSEDGKCTRNPRRTASRARRSRSNDGGSCPQVSCNVFDGRPAPVNGLQQLREDVVGGGQERQPAVRLRMADKLANPMASIRHKRHRTATSCGSVDRDQQN